MANIDVEDVLSKLTLTDKADLLAGIDIWHTKPIPKHGVPSLRFSDGPNGIRGTKFFNSVPAACLPCGTSLGSTFNTELLKRAGRKMGEEAKLKGAHVVLGPTINIQRSPLGGRGFESFSEDPTLSGLGAAALVKGIQSTGVQATAKHFVCNDQEHKRNAANSIVSGRALREIYAMPFQLLVRDAEPGAFMTGYNGVNGTFCSENKELLETMLRQEWGFSGLVMSDWYGTYSTTDAALAGLDIEMPGPPRFRGEALKFNVATNKVPEFVVDERARTVLELIKRCAASGIPENAPEREGNTPETAALLREMGIEGTVLLKNEDGLLPLKKDKKTLVVGPNAKLAMCHGGGSAALRSYYAITPYEGISAKLTQKPEYVLGAYSHLLLPLLSNVTTADGKPGMSMKVYREPPTAIMRELVEYIHLEKSDMLLVDYNNKRLSDTWFANIEGTLVADEDCTFELSLIVCGTAKLFVNGDMVIDNATKQVPSDYYFSYGTAEEKGTYKFRRGETYVIKVEFGSTPTSPLAVERVLLRGGALRIGGCKIIDSQQEIIRAADAARDAEQVVICLGLNADWETEGSDRETMKLPGHLDALVSAVTAANPSVVIVNQSGTPVEMPWIASVKAVVQAWYGGNETGNVIADVLFGDANPSGKLPLSWPIRGQDNPAFLNIRCEAGRTLYGEDVYVGYRYYEFAERQVLFPFGHGLSYTTFKLSDMEVAEAGGVLTVTVTVSNTGKKPGSETIQTYVKPPPTKVTRPIKELKGFAKVRLDAGETKRITITAQTKYATSYWCEERRKFAAEKGRYEVVVDTSSETTANAMRGFFAVDKTCWWTGV
ncbi:putative beta-glucosidase I [Ceratocystis platani]|uniref:beta-glucosidase n=1 Tax=Ceratocystis fimbriata f. sp. platani TaxID=88771 RepID=A0A0F8CW75_CERFI|nr:putative beta-glucosidase I [Ceratocystis platani]